MKNLLLRSKSKSLLILLQLFIIVALTGFSQIERWVLAQPVAMADQALAGFGFYPSISRGLSDIGMQLYADTSVYFPGVAIIGALVQILISKALVYEVMVVVAAFVLCSLSVTLHRLSMLFVCEKDNMEDRQFVFLALNLIWLIFICEMFLSYSSVFKPDAISILCGVYGLLLLFKSESRINTLLGGMFIGLGILFKQQYLSFFIGYLIVSIFLSSVIKNSRLALLSSVITAFVCLTFIYNEDRNFFWTIRVVMDDGFLPLETIIDEHAATILKCVSIAIILVTLMWLSQVKFVPPSIGKDEIFLSVPIIFFVGACFLSSLKLGGNVGNTQIGIYVIFPVLCILFGPTVIQVFDGMTLAPPVKSFVLLLVVSVLAAYVGLKGVVHLGSYLEARELRAYFASLPSHEVRKSLIAHRSFCYYGVRELRQPQLYVSLNSANLLNSGFERYIEMIDRSAGFSIVALGNTKENLEYLESRGGFSIQKQTQRCVIGIAKK